MKSKSIFLLFIFLLFIPLLSAQQYSSEKYERYVGWQSKKYKPTTADIQKAINDLSSVVSNSNVGIVHLPPGLIELDSAVILKKNVFLNGTKPISTSAETWIDFISGTALRLKPSTSDYSKNYNNFLFVIKDTVQAGEAEVFGLSNLYLMLDSTSKNTAIAQAGIIYFDVTKSDFQWASTNFRGTNLRFQSNVTGSAGFYIPDFNRAYSSYYIQLHECQLINPLPGFAPNNPSVSDLFVLKDSSNCSQDSYPVFHAYNSRAMEGNIYSYNDNKKTWDFRVTNVIGLFDLQMSTYLRASEVTFSGIHQAFNNCALKFTGVGSSNYFFTNIDQVNKLHIDIDSLSSSGKVYIDDIICRDFNWSSGFKFNIRAGSPTILVKNSFLTQQQTTANYGVINLDTGSASTKLWIFNSTLLSKTSSNISVYSPVSSTGTNYFYNSQFSDTVSTNITYTGDHNAFIPY